MSRRRPPVDNTRHRQLRIVDEATHRAWSMLWPDMPPKAEPPLQPDLLSPAPESAIEPAAN